ncbi:MAG: hypothetical protein OXH52_16055 [Gammaproteobacteria bacterium]|nr:hypothetical protein [Gammaproteobacteria bacterium]
MNQAGQYCSNAMQARFRRDGFLAPVPIMDAADAASHHEQLEHAEAVCGDLHYQAKVYANLRPPLELATNPDRFHHPGVDVPAPADPNPNAIARQRDLDRQVRETMGEKSCRP